MQRSNRYDGIQVLRFVAALMVVITHSTFYASERLDPSFQFWQRGATGVDIFFVISGFVMVVSSQRGDGWIDWREFFYRRVVRIFPPYWVATTLNLLVLVAIPSMVLHSSLDWQSVLKSYLLIPDYNSDGNIEPLLGVGWTLYFESFFYAAFAVALVLRLNPIWSVTAIMVAAAAASGLRGEGWPAYAVYLDPIVLEFAAGMLIGKLARSLRAPLWAGVLVLVAAFAVLLLRPDPPGWPRALVTGVPAATLVLCAVLLEPYLQGKKWMAPLVFMGAASYVLYLFHPVAGAGGASAPV